MAFYVGIKNISGNTNIQIKPLSQQPDPGARGIFDADVTGDGYVTLDVFLTPNEVQNQAEVKLYKDKVWDRARNQGKIVTFPAPVLGWEGYIEVQLQQGDPPIAVG